MAQGHQVLNPKAIIRRVYRGRIIDAIGQLFPYIFAEFEPLKFMHMIRYTPWKSLLIERISLLKQEKIDEINSAIKFALDLA